MKNKFLRFICAIYLLSVIGISLALLGVGIREIVSPTPPWWFKILTGLG